MNHKGLVVLWFLFLNIYSALPVAADGIKQTEDSNQVNVNHNFWKTFRQDSILSFRNRKGYFPMLFHNLGQQAVSPFHMTGKEALFVAGVSAFTTGMLFLDADIDRGFRPVKNRNPFLKQISPEFTQLGDYYGYGLLAAYGAYSMVFKKHKALHTAMLASQAAISAGLWVRLIKVCTGRMRPGATYADRQYNEDHWFGPITQFDPDTRRGRSVAAFDAFPSGHTAAAFALAGVFAIQYSEYRAVPYVAYSLASLVAVSRLVEHEHWASDLLPGALIGYACSRQVVHYYRSLFPEYSNRYNRKQHNSFIYFSNSGIPKIHYTLVF